MKTLKNNEFNIVREIFIETLNTEFTSETGFGVYAHISPINVNQLFKQYLKQNNPIDNFVRYSVKTHINKFDQHSSI